MLEIAYTLCFLAKAECKERTLPIAENLTPMQCMMKAQAEVAREVEPYGDGVRVTRISCRRPSKET